MSASLTQIDLPVYVTRIVQISRIIRIASPPDQAEGGMNSAMLIGTVSGAALICALIVAAVIFIVRSRRAGAQGSSEDSADTITPSISAIPKLDTDADVGGDEENIELAQSLAQFGEGESDDTMLTGHTERGEGNDLTIYV
jgi:hypothetical protein